MRNEDLVNSIRDKYLALSGVLHERGCRHWAAAEARSLGWGGITLVAQATGISDRTIRTGIKELNDATLPDLGRQRRPGAGRRAREIEQPDLQQSLINLIDSTTRGDPTSALKWTCKSTRALSCELQKQGFDISRTKVQQMLQHLGYSLQSNKKTVE